PTVKFRYRQPGNVQAFAPFRRPHIVLITPARGNCAWPGRKTAAFITGQSSAISAAALGLPGRRRGVRWPGLAVVSLARRGCPRGRPGRRGRGGVGLLSRLLQRPRHPAEHRPEGRAPDAGLMTAARHHYEWHTHHPGLQYLPEVLRGEDILRILGADRQPEGGELVADRHPGDVVARRVDEPQAG